MVILESGGEAKIARSPARREGQGLATPFAIPSRRYLPSSIVIEASELVALLAQDSAVLNIAPPTRIADDYAITIYTERFTGIHVTCFAFLV